MKRNHFSPEYATSNLSSNEDIVVPAQQQVRSQYTDTALGWGDLFEKNGQVLKNYTPHIHQARCLASKARFVGAIAGTGGGKTALGPLWVQQRIVETIQKYSVCTGMIIAPTYKVLSRATMPALVETLKGTNLEGVYKESKSQYVLPNNWGIIWCQGADNPGGLEGGQFDFVWGDEGGQFKTKTFHAIEGRTGAKQAPILITTTPYGLGYLHDVWYTNFLAGDKDYFIEQWASHINPAYPDEEVERARRALPPHKFAERYLGKFSKAEGLVYDNFHKCHSQISQDDLRSLLSRNGNRFYGGLDFGWNDPFCALNGCLDSEDMLHIWFERYKSETIIEDHANHLPRTELFGHSSTIWSADHNPECIKKLQRAGFTVRKAKKNILPGIMAVAARVNTNRIKVYTNRCRALAAEAERYRYPDKDEEIVGDVPIDKDNHAMDALRYLVMQIDHKNAA